MKKNILFISSALFFTVNCIAQDYQNEIGFSPLRIETLYNSEGASAKFHLPFWTTCNNCEPTSYIQTSSFPSIYFTTRLYKKLSLRLNYHFTRTRIDYDLPQQSTYPYQSWQYDNHILATGLQFNLMPGKKTNFYIIADVTHQIEFANASFFHKNNKLLQAKTEQLSELHIGVAPGFGLRHFIFKRYSASIEYMPSAMGVGSYPLARLSINHHF